MTVSPATAPTIAIPIGTSTSPIAAARNDHGLTGGMSVGYARLIGSGSAGLLELAIFHPVDTIAKRLMTSTDRYIQSSFRETASSLNKTIFRDKANKSAGTKLFSLFPGLGYAACYKVSQRVYKYGGQPVVADYMHSHWGKAFRDYFGERRGNQMSAATSGSLIGVGEVFLLPFDVMKIKAQTKHTNAATVLAGAMGAVPPLNPNAAPMEAPPSAVPKPSLLNTIRTLYAGAGWTILRNAPGSFALFGANAFMYSSVLGVDNPKIATFAQTFMASTVAACASIIVAAPIDTIKTRIQKQEFGSVHQNGRQIIGSLIREEGITALFKGLTPKLIVVGPKLVFSFTMAQYFIAHLQK